MFALSGPRVPHRVLIQNWGHPPLYRAPDSTLRCTQPTLSLGIRPYCLISQIYLTMMTQIVSGQGAIQQQNSMLAAIELNYVGRSDVTYASDTDVKCGVVVLADQSMRRNCPRCGCTKGKIVIKVKLMVIQRSPESIYFIYCFDFGQISATKSFRQVCKSVSLMVAIFLKLNMPTEFAIVLIWADILVGANGIHLPLKTWLIRLWACCHTIVN